MRTYEETRAFLAEHPGVLAIWRRLDAIDHEAVDQAWHLDYEGSFFEDAPACPRARMHDDRFCPLGAWMLYDGCNVFDIPYCGGSTPDEGLLHMYLIERHAANPAVADVDVGRLDNEAGDFYEEYDARGLDTRAVREQLGLEVV